MVLNKGVRARLFNGFWGWVLGMVDKIDVCFEELVLNKGLRLIDRKPYKKG